jgi:hypothetical protein
MMYLLGPLTILNDSANFPFGLILVFLHLIGLLAILKFRRIYLIPLIALSWMFFGLVGEGINC